MIITKQQLRKQMLKKRSLLDSVSVREYSDSLFEAFLRSDLTDYENYMVYMPINNETDTKKLIEYLFLHNKNVSVPLIDKDKKLVPLQIFKDSEYEKSGFGISVPKNRIYVNPESIEVVFVPGLVFDKAGNRIGYGKGYYDAFLSDLDCITCAWCYDFQIIEKIEDISDHDIKIQRFLNKL